VSFVNGQASITIDPTLLNADHYAVSYGSIPGNPIVPAVCPAQAPIN
jgi:hypothetical protein